MTHKEVDKIMRTFDGRLCHYTKPNLVFELHWFMPEFRFRRIHPKVAGAWLARDLGVIASKDDSVTRYRSKSLDWSCCDECGSLIPLSDYSVGAKRELAEPDSHFGPEEYITLCWTCNSVNTAHGPQA